MTWLLAFPSHQRPRYWPCILFLEGGFRLPKLYVENAIKFKTRWNMPFLKIYRNLRFDLSHQSATTYTPPRLEACDNWQLGISIKHACMGWVASCGNTEPEILFTIKLLNTAKEVTQSVAKPPLDFSDSSAKFGIQWNLSVTTTCIIKSITCDLFHNVF